MTKKQTYFTTSSPAWVLSWVRGEFKILREDLNIQTTSDIPRGSKASVNMSEKRATFPLRRITSVLKSAYSWEHESNPLTLQLQEAQLNLEQQEKKPLVCPLCNRYKNKQVTLNYDLTNTLNQLSSHVYVARKLENCTHCCSYWSKLNNTLTLMTFIGPRVHVMLLKQ